MPTSNALSTSFIEELLYQKLTMGALTLNAPQDIAFSVARSLLTWRPPHGERNYTHFQIWIDDDSGDPMFEVPAGQLALVVPFTCTAFVAAANIALGLRGERVSQACVAGGGGGSGSGSNTTIYTTLPSGGGTTTFNPGGGATGETLVYEFTQDSPGGHSIAWGANVAASVPTDVALGAGAITVYDLYGKAGVWYLKSNAVVR